MLKEASGYKLVSELPAKERHFVKRITPSGFVFYTTGKQDRSQYSLYLETEDGFLLVKKAAEPVGFDDIALSWGSEPAPKKRKARKDAQSS